MMRWNNRRASYAELICFQNGSVNVVGLSHVIERTFHFYCICVSFFGGAAAVIDGKNKIIRCCII